MAALIDVHETAYAFQSIVGMLAWLDLGREVETIKDIHKLMNYEFNVSCRR